MVCTIALNLIPIRYDVDGNHELDKDELEWLMCDLLGRHRVTPALVAKWKANADHHCTELATRAGQCDTSVHSSLGKGKRKRTMGLYALTCAETLPCDACILLPWYPQDVFDTDQDGTISFSEFVHSIPSLLQEEVPPRHTHPRWHAHT